MTLQNLSAAGELATAAVKPKTLRKSTPRRAVVVPLDFGESTQTTTVVSLAEIFGYLRKRWKLGVLIALPLAAVTFSMLGMGAKVYEAEARLLLRIQDQNVFNFNEIARTTVTEISAPMLVNNHRAELKARRFVDYLYSHIGEDDRNAFLAQYAPKKSWKDPIKSLLGMSAPAKPLPPEDLFATKLSEATRVEPLKDSHILRVQIRAGDAALAARLANHYIEDYIRYVSEQELTVTHAETEFLEGKGEEIRTRLEDSEKQLASYRESQSLVQDSEIKDIAGEKVRLLTMAISDAEVKRAKAKQDHEMIKLAASNKREPLDLKIVAENPDVVASRKLLEAKIAERAPLEVFCGRRHPRMIAINQEIETYRKALDRNIAAVMTMTDQDETNIDRQIEDLQRQLKAAQAAVFAQGGKNIQQKLLSDKVAMDRELYQKISLRMNQSDLTGQFKDSGLLRVADTAVAPEKPLKPNKPVALLASMLVFGFFMLGVPVGYGFCEEQLAPKLRGIPADETALPGEDEAPATPGALTTLAPEQLVIGRLPDVANATPTNLLSEFLRTGAASADSLRDMVSMLETRAKQRSGPGVIFISSAESGEGKTSLSSALAAAFCNRGRRVFMIECNATSPTFHLLFPHAYTHATWNKDGLDALRYGTSNLYILPNHQHSASGEMIDVLENYRGWIEKARPEVDWIILDGSSIMQNFADVTPLLPLATDVILVQDALSSSAAHVKGALNLLRPRLSKSAFCGVVMNRVRD
ncbi:MAG: hypothetical protein WCN98_08650 [Verrucomicrobiaceae bacterium]